MKTAIYIEDGVVQLVLTPENKFEKDALGSFENKPLRTIIKTGTFYDCQGGWTRHSNQDNSLIIRADLRVAKETGETP